MTEPGEEIADVPARGTAPYQTPTLTMLGSLSTVTSGGGNGPDDGMGGAATTGSF